MSRDNVSTRWGLLSTLRQHGLAKSAKLLVVNVILSVALVLPVFIFLGARAEERVVLTADKSPWLRFYDDPSTSMVVSWETSEMSNSYVLYGESSTSLDMIAADASMVLVHHVYLSGLSQNTRYYYRAGHNSTGTPVLGATFSFMTAPVNVTAPFTFLAISDTQESTLGINHHAVVADGLAREARLGARFTLHAGDVADSGTDQDEWNYYWKHAATYSASLPILPAIGNHDDHGSQPMFRKYFAFRAPGEPLYYSFNYSSLLHVTALKITYGRETDFTSPGGMAMMGFLAADLAAAASMPFKIVYFHCPIISSGFFGVNQVVMDNIRPFLAQYNVTVVITGHDHHYERLIMDSTTHLVIGGGGGVLDPCHNVLQETRAVTSIPHYARFTIDPAQGMSFEACTPQGNVFDAAFFPLP
ncbi:MAG: metallophosphoesterase family protein [Candidatus Lokiarchaeota archaeon]|nr:metallophosphoesterase family protein [Candidatus Lokiarchaeota archaeon]